MREPKYFVASTVDGFIAAEDGSLDAFVNDRAYFTELLESFPEVRGTPTPKAPGWCSSNPRGGS